MKRPFPRLPPSANPAGRSLSSGDRSDCNIQLSDRLRPEYHPPDRLYTLKHVLIVPGSLVPRCRPLEFPTRMVSPPKQIPTCRSHHNAPGARMTVREVVILYAAGQPLAVYLDSRKHPRQQPRSCIDPGHLSLHWSISLTVAVKRIFEKRTFHQFCRHHSIQPPLEHPLSSVTI